MSTNQRTQQKAHREKAAMKKKKRDRKKERTERVGGQCFFFFNVSTPLDWSPQFLSACSLDNKTGSFKTCCVFLRSCASPNHHIWITACFGRKHVNHKPMMQLLWWSTEHAVLLFGDCPHWVCRVFHVKPMYEKTIQTRFLVRFKGFKTF